MRFGSALGLFNRNGLLRDRHSPRCTAAPVFVAMLSVTVPERLLDVATGTVIHGAALAADHVQPVSVSTATESVPPSAETVALAGDTPKRHGAASCVSDTSMCSLDRRLARRRVRVSR